MTKVPTGITSLDPVIGGGVPPGSVILLAGEQGAGSREFVYSSLISLSMMKERNAGHEDILIPEEIVYTTFTRLSSSIENEIHNSFSSDLTESVGRVLKYIDLSEIYFESSIVPTHWYSSSSVIERFQKKSVRNSSKGDSILQSFASQISGLKPHSLIVIDSITDIATEELDPEKWRAMIGFLRGIQRISKKWETTFYILLSEGILSGPKVVEIADCCDGMLTFGWEDNTGRMRQRKMYIEKFAGIMTHLEEKNLVKFASRITPEAGFEVSNIRMVI